MKQFPFRYAVLGSASLFVMGACLDAAASPRLTGPGGVGLDSWFEVFFEQGSNSGVQLVTDTNGVQRAVAITVGVVCPELNLAQANAQPLTTGQADLRDRCNEIVEDIVDSGSDPAAQSDAFDGLQEMGAEENSAIANTEVDFSAGHEAHVSNRMASIRAGLAGPTMSLQGQTFAVAEALGAATGGNAGSAMSRWSFFVDASFGEGDKDATSLESGFDADSTTVTAGIDYSPDDRITTGIALGFTNLDADLDNDGGKLETDSRSIFLYTTWFGPNRWYMDGMLGYTANDHDQERNLRYSISTFGVPGTTTVDNTANSNNDSDEWSFSLQMGRDYQAGGWVLGPYGRFAYAQTEIDGYRETMVNPAAAGGGLAVAIDSQEYASKTLALGAMAYTDFTTGWGLLVPQLSAEYVHEFDNDNDPITGYFINSLSNTRFSIPTDAPDRNYFNLGAGLTAFVRDDIQIYLQYQTQLGYRDLDLYDVKLGVKASF